MPFDSTFSSDNYTYSNGDRTIMRGASGWTQAALTTLWSDKVYLELVVNTMESGYAAIGLSPAPAVANAIPGYYVNGYCYFSTGTKCLSSNQYSFGSAYSPVDVVGMFLDNVTGKIWWSVNGVVQGGGDPELGLNPAFVTSIEDMAIIAGADVSGTTLTVNTTSGQLVYDQSAIGFAALDGAGVQEIVTGLVQRWGYPIEKSLSVKWGDAAHIVRGLNIYWRSARLLQSGCKEAWNDALQIARGLTGTYSLLSNPQAGLVQRWSILEAAIASGLIEVFDIKDTDPLSAGLNQFWNIFEGGGVLHDSFFSIVAGGIVLQSITECSAGLAEDQAFNTATIKITDRGEFTALAKGHNVTITQFGVAFEYFVSGKDSGWSATGSADGPKWEEQYTIRCESKTAALHRPYAADLNQEWTGGGSAAEIVQELADIEGLTVDFQADDFLVPKDFLIAEKETPWEVIQKITSPLLLSEQTEPDGILTIRESYPDRPADWSTTAPSYSLSADGDFYTYSEQHNDDQIVYNMVSVQDKEVSAAEALTLEAEDISAQEKIVRAWEVPWVGDFMLSHSGGSYVEIYTDGIKQDGLLETIEIVDGLGSVPKPVYSIVEFEYLKDDLGAIEFLEDGTITTSIVGNSLLRITYMTQYYQFRVRDNKIEKLQVFVNGVQV